MVKARFFTKECVPMERNVLWAMAMGIALVSVASDGASRSLRVSKTHSPVPGV